MLVGGRSRPGRPRKRPARSVAAPATSTVYTIKPGPNAQSEFLATLIQSSPGDIIELAAGTFNFDIDLEVTTNNITIRGAGMDKTILSFKNQHMGSKGIEASGDNFVIENLSVEDTRGNAIKVVGSKNVTFRNVRTDWLGEPKTANGAYGIYPVSVRKRADRRLHRSRGGRRGRVCRSVARHRRQELPRL